MSIVTLDEDKHVYTDERGLVWPGVTTIIKPLYDFSRVPPETLRRKAELGRLVHRCTELIDRGEDISAWLAEKAQDDVRPYLDAYADFLDQMAPLMVCSEMVVWSERWRYAGKLDRILKLDGEPFLVDYKTTWNVEPPVWVQLAGYANTDQVADRKFKSLRRAVLKLENDGRWRWMAPADGNDPRHWGCFAAHLQAHYWKETYL